MTNIFSIPTPPKQKPSIQVSTATISDNSKDFNARYNVIPAEAKNKVTLVGNEGGPYDSGLGLVRSAGPTRKELIRAVTFDITPELEESGSNSLITIDSIRAPASIVIWMGTHSRRFTISATFVSRTVKEATNNFKNISLLKAWRMPMSSTLGQSSAMISKYQIAPETLRLYAYKDNIRGVPVVVGSLNITYPSSVDYIPTDNGTPMPIITKLTISLTEVHNLAGFKVYNYEKFKLGLLEGW